VLDGTNGSGNVTAGGRKVVLLKLGAVTGLPANVTLTQPTASVLANGTITGGTITFIDWCRLHPDSQRQRQDSNFYFTINNASGATINVTDVSLKTDLQQRKFGGRVDNTMLGWVMEEADRVMRNLAAVRTSLPARPTASATPGLPTGFQKSARALFCGRCQRDSVESILVLPKCGNTQTLHGSGYCQATVVFDQSSVRLDTQSLLEGTPRMPLPEHFADFFNAHYDQLAALSFPVHDPTDPTFTRVINVPIFAELRDAMKAVSLARFFHDNNIPLDTWWLNSYKPATASIPLVIPSLTNSASDGLLTVTFHGGVTIKLPNTYIADTIAQQVEHPLHIYTYKLSRRDAAPHTSERPLHTASSCRGRAVSEQRSDLLSLTHIYLTHSDVPPPAAQSRRPVHAFPATDLT